MLNVKALLLFLAATHALAAPGNASNNEELIIFANEDTPFGTLTYYGLAPGENATTTSILSVRACGTNDVKCDTSHVPPAGLCLDLITLIGSPANRNNVLPSSSRSVCLSLIGKCCISWRNAGPNLTEGDLSPAAVKTYDSCVVNGESGLTTNTDLRGVCTRQCLSNRATDC